MSRSDFSAQIALFITLVAGPVAAAPAQAPPAQASPGARPAATAQVIIDTPPPPVAPDVIARNDKGRATIRAVRVDRPIVADGALDEEVYARVAGASDFVQQLPRNGEAATDKTEVWILYDDRNVYIAVKCWDNPPGHEIATEMRRDSSNVTQNDSISILLDTFYDRRNGYSFQTTPLGLIRDQSIVDDGVNESWNTVWEVKSSRYEWGWSFEMAIPFKSLRYAASGPQTWGFNIRRIVKWKNEFSYLSAVPASHGMGAINRVGDGGTMVGLETPAQSKNLEIKPYAVSTLTTDRTAAVPFTNQGDANVGFDFKYGLTRGLTADMTVNTDFAQVEEDVQQVNLTRFSLLYPEKRDFFLEGLGIFAFGGVSAGSLRGNSGPVDAEVPIMFFSRQIGLANGQSVPVRAGGRVTGKAGAYTLGAMNIQTGEKPEAGAVSTNFTAFRLKRDILRRSSVGVIATRRAPTNAVVGTNLLAGADANFQLSDDLEVGGYWARTDTPGLTGRDTSYRARASYDGDRYGLYGEHILIDANFNPQSGFLRRNDFRRSFGEARFSPRTKASRTVRRYTWQVDLDHVTNAPATVVQNTEYKGLFGIEFHNSDTFNVDVRQDYELLPRDFAIAPGVRVPKGGYDYHSVNGSYTLGQQHPVSGKVTTSVGTLYGGTKSEVTYAGRVVLPARVALEPGITLDWVRLPYGDFNVRLLNTRIIFTPTPRMLVSSLIQYSEAAHAINSSVRFSWEYIPGSQLFLVYSDGRDTAYGGTAGLLNRSFAVKITRLLRL